MDRKERANAWKVKTTRKNTKVNYECDRCGRKYLSTTKVPDNCPSCSSSDVNKI